MIDRTEEIGKTSGSLTNSHRQMKIRYVEAARRRLKYYRTLKLVKDDKQ